MIAFGLTFRYGLFAGSHGYLPYNDQRGIFLDRHGGETYTLAVWGGAHYDRRFLCVGIIVVRRSRDFMPIPATTTSPTEPVVRVQGLSKTYRLMTGREIPALRNVTFSIKKGETFAIVGPNGSGKTTAMKILLGLLFPDDRKKEGAASPNEALTAQSTIPAVPTPSEQPVEDTGPVTIFNLPPGDNRVQKNIGYLPEAPYFYEYLNGRELLVYYGKLCGVPEAELGERADALLRMPCVDLHERGGDMPIRYYSRGMRQRIGIAQSMINDPALLILDEPTNGLDPIGTVQVRQFILQQKKLGRTILLCSHLLSEVEAVADRVLILNKGEVVAMGPVSELVPESRQWQLVCTGACASVVTALRAAGYAPDIQGEVISISRESQDEILVALGMLRDAGADLVELTRPQPSLEDLFLKAVGDDRKAHASTGKKNKGYVRGK
jgi:ABC-2 type transport system ATP-binding protein